MGQFEADAAGRRALAGGVGSVPRAARSYDWLVVGAGPAGLAAVGKLLDSGVAGSSIGWIDPLFTVGDLGLKWKGVSSNTKAHLFRAFLKGCRSFGYEEAEGGFALDALEAQDTCLLERVVEPLQWITNRLQSKVSPIRSKVTKLRRVSHAWMVATPEGVIEARNVILAIGAEPLKLRHSVPVIGLEDALDPEKVKRVIESGDVVGVFGSSHSAMMAVRNLIDAGAKRVINFYRSPLRFAVDYGDWIRYDNTGLKGRTAEWAREDLGRISEETLLRVSANDENVSRYLPRCSKVVYGIGFGRRTVATEGADLTRYDAKTGVIAHGLYGCGIAYPERVVDRVGNVEYNVGLWKFIQYLDRVVPVWTRTASRAMEPKDPGGPARLEKPGLTPKTFDYAHFTRTRSLRSMPRLHN